MKLSEILSTRVRKRRNSFFPTMDGAQPTKIIEQIKAIHKRWPAVAGIIRSLKSPEEICAAFLPRLDGSIPKSDEYWQGVSWIDICEAVRALWESGLWDLEKYSGLRQFLDAILRKQPRPHMLLTYLNVYMDTFDSNSERTRALSKLLKARKEKLPDMIQDLDKQYDLLSPERAVDKLAILLEGLEDPFNELKAIGIQAPHSLGLMEKVHERYLINLRPSLSEGDAHAHDHIFRWICPNNVERYEIVALQSIDAILLPLEGKEATLAEDRRDKITSLITGNFGDPRLRRNKPQWISDRAIKVLKAMLTGATLRAFLDIVSNVIRNERDYHMWPTRRRFWEALYDDGDIVEAWVILSKEGEREAERLSGQGSSIGKLEYARADFAQASGDVGKCFLLLRLSERCGGKVILEGSHNFKVHIYEPDDKVCPPFYESSYQVSELRRTGSHEPIIHNVKWRNKVKEIIYTRAFDR